MVTYQILDLACRQDDLAAAFNLRWRSQKSFGYENRDVNCVLSAFATGIWVSFWRVRRRVDGFFRALLHWEITKVRRTALKIIGRSYVSSELSWILQSSAGAEMDWEELVKQEDVGWSRDGDQVTIRKPKQ